MTAVVINANGAGYGHVLVDGVELAGVAAVSVEVRAGQMPVVRVDLVPTSLLLQLPDAGLTTTRSRMEAAMDQTPRCAHGVQMNDECDACNQSGRQFDQGKQE